MLDSVSRGKALGRKHFAAIAAQSERWKNRNIPVFIRTSLFVPYYMVEKDGFQELHIIHPPIRSGDKVHFYCYARAALDEEHPEICDCEK